MMTRRQAAAAALAPLLQTQSSRPWNILWLSCEDTSPDLGCYGDAQAVTPNLDRFASEGVRFTHAFSTYGVCAPTRSSIITGMYPASIGTHHMRSRGVPPPEVKCFPEYLRAAGYYCTNNRKTDYNFDPPASAWDESSPKAHWQKREKDQPFFAVFNFEVSHEGQIRAPEAAYQRNTDRLRPEQRHDPAKMVVPSFYPDTPVIRRDIARYYDGVTAVDYQVADMLKQLDEEGLRDNTIVFFWGDHGRGLPRYKRWPWDTGTRVPLMIRQPGVIRPGSVDSRLVSLLDLGPTVLSLAGLTPPAHLQGEAFLGAKQKAPRQYVFTARDRMDETYDMMRSVRDHRWRYVKNYNPEVTYAQRIDYMDMMPSLQEMRRLHAEGKLTGAQKLFFADRKPVEELYDTEKDPENVVNLAADPQYASQLERLRAVHLRFMQETKDLGQMPEPQLKERMRPGGIWQTTATPVVGRQGELVTATCSTPGASIVYTMQQSETPHWRLYTKPLAMGLQSIRFKACRLGYKDSGEAMITPPRERPA
jgi:N-sulfoglucosamine sulfohydrolase